MIFLLYFFLIPNRYALGTLRKYQKSSAIDASARSEKAIFSRAQRFQQ
jgi:hypothetical protein